MEKHYTDKLRCITCACEDFEFNEDKSYVKCTNCGHEYFGGYNELLQYNQDVQNEVMVRLQEDAEKMVQEEFKKAFKGIKNITIK